MQLLVVAIIPVVDPHMQQTKDHLILNPDIVVPLQLFRVADHIRPQGVIVMEICESIGLTTIFTLDLVPVLLARDARSNNATVANLESMIVISQQRE